MTMVTVNTLPFSAAKLSRRRSSRAKQQGFTLLELLIAMAVSAVIAVMAYQAVASMVKVEQGVSSSQQQLQKLQRAFWWMEQDFIQMTPRPVNDGLGGSLPALSYRTDLGIELSRLANFMTPYSQNGVMRVGYQLEDNKLYRLIWAVADRVSDTEVKRIPVLNDVESWELRLLDNQDTWQSDWPNTVTATEPNAATNLSALPKLVEVKLTFTHGETITRLFRGTDNVVADFSSTQDDSNNNADNDSDAPAENNPEGTTQ